MLKVESIDRRLVEYDMKRIFFVSSFLTGIDLSTINNITVIWTNDGIDMLLYWDQILLKQACYWQLTMNLQVLTNFSDRTSMQWALIFVQASCTPDLLARVAMRFNQLH